MSMILGLIPVTREAITGLHASPDTVIDFIQGAKNGCDLDKAWHGIHFLLSGDEWSGPLPEGMLLAGGRPIGDVDVGYGPARALLPEEAESFQRAIEKISDAEFDARFDAKKLLDHSIYPEIWDRDLKGEPDGRPYLNEYFKVLKQFFADAVKEKQGVVVFMA